MSISRIISSTTSSSNADATTKLNSLSPNSNGSVGADARESNPESAASVSISQDAQLMSQLQQSDSDKFKSVMTDIATKLKDAARQTSGDSGQILSNIAGKFDEAAQSGNLSSLQPTRRYHGHPASAGLTAYQQVSGQSNVLPSVSSHQSAASAADLRSEIGHIINQVVKQDLGSTSN